MIRLFVRIVLLHAATRQAASLYYEMGYLVAVCVCEQCDGLWKSVAAASTPHCHRVICPMRSMDWSELAAIVCQIHMN